MKIRVPTIVKDASVAQVKMARALIIDEITITIEEDFFLDGPVTSRLAVVDFDANGRLGKGVPFDPDSARYVYGDIPDGRVEMNADSQFLAVSVFGTVWKTLDMFEERDAMGRKVDWAFDAPQLLIVPRAGELLNAFYERDSHSLQFFYQTGESGRVLITAASQDIVAHETAHAILDGIAPDLYSAITPQSLALHESIADLTTVLMAFRSRELAQAILDQTGGSIDYSNAFTWVAREFGQELQRSSLRDLSVCVKMSDLSSDGRSDPHKLSEVLSGALYPVLADLFDTLKEEFRGDESPNRAPAKGYDRVAVAEVDKDNVRSFGESPTVHGEMATWMKALYVAGERFKRIIYRALDYLPPGDVTFADYGRAIIASDEVSHPDSGAERRHITETFIDRGIVATAKELGRRTRPTKREVRDIGELDLEMLKESDWVAYEFANSHRRLLGIPKGLPFRVRPRQDVTRNYYHRGVKEPIPVRECLFKVSWNEEEDNPIGNGLPSRRQLVRGTTLAIDWETKQVRVCLTGNPAPAAAERDAFLKGLISRGLLADGLSLSGEHPSLPGEIRVERVGDAMRVRGASSMLHFHGVEGSS